MRKLIYKGYLISEDGTILPKKGRSKKFKIDRYGYPQVGLWENGKVKYYTVHRLLALLFLPNPNNLPCINHKDGNKENYSLDNLEWCTYRHNAKHAIKTGLWKFKPRSVIGAKRDDKGRFCGA